jgi:zinc-ribbon domain
LGVCSQCGQENKEGAKFCVNCGSSLAAPPAQAAAAAPPPAQAAGPPPVQPAAPPPAQPAGSPPVQPAAPPPAQPAAPPQQPAPTAAQAPPPVAQPYTAPVQPAQPPVQQPAAYAPPQQAYPPAAAYPAAAAAYAKPAKTRGMGFWIGAAIVLVAGILIIISSFTPWISGPLGFRNLSGWDVKELTNNPFFDYGDGYPIFTGVCSLIAGGVIALLGILLLLTKAKAWASLAIIISIASLGIAITNLTTILRTEGLNMGAGMYLFLIFSLLGIIGGGVAAAD